MGFYKFAGGHLTKLCIAMLKFGVVGQKNGYLLMFFDWMGLPFGSIWDKDQIENKKTLSHEEFDSVFYCRFVFWCRPFKVSGCF